MPPHPTHFLCIPLVTPTSRPQLSTTLSTFRDALLTNPSYAIPIEAIRPLGTLHLTLGVMTLSTAPDIERATGILKGLKLSEILSDIRKKKDGPEATTGDLVIKLTGLRAMQQPRETSVLYAVPGDAKNILYPFCVAIREKFAEAGILGNDGRSLLLHATIVNTVYVPGQRRSRNGSGSRWAQRKFKFNAEGLLEDYQGYEWVTDVSIKELTVCRMVAKKVGGDDGEVYEVVERTEM